MSELVPLLPAQHWQMLVVWVRDPWLPGAGEGVLSMSRVSCVSGAVARTLFGFLHNPGLSFSLSSKQGVGQSSEGEWDCPLPHGPWDRRPGPLIPDPDDFPLSLRPGRS